MVKYLPMTETMINAITFPRHRESVGNLENRFQGHADFPLTEQGCFQAESLARCWKVEGITFDRGFSNPLLRARETDTGNYPWRHPEYGSICHLGHPTPSGFKRATLHVPQYYLNSLHLRTSPSQLANATHRRPYAP